MTHPEPATHPAGAAQDWRTLLAVLWVTSLAEGICVSQVFAFLPTYLTELGVTGDDRLRFLCCCAPAYRHQDTYFS